MIVFLGLVFDLSCCRHDCNCREQINSPIVPKEIRNTRYIYSDMPAIITFRQFQEQLTQFACQLTVVYLIYPDSEYDMNLLSCMSNIQKHFYRYGVRVLVIDLHSAIHWPELKSILYRVYANFIAEYLNSDGVLALEKFLHFRNDVNKIFVIDSMNNNYVYRIYNKQCWQIIRKVKSILANRDKNVSD